MKTLILLILSITLLSKAEAETCSGQYYGLLTGINYTHLSDLGEVQYTTHPGFMVGGLYGYKFCRPLRLEGELAYRYNSVKRCKGHINCTTLMGNLLYELPARNRIEPYLGGGAGLKYASGTFDLKDSYYYKEYQVYVDLESFYEFNFVFQTLIGVNFQLFERTDLHLDYRYLSGPWDRVSCHTVAFTYLRFF